MAKRGIKSKNKMGETYTKHETRVASPARCAGNEWSTSFLAGKWKKRYRRRGKKSKGRKNKREESSRAASFYLRKNNARSAGLKKNRVSLESGG